MDPVLGTAKSNYGKTRERMVPGQIRNVVNNRNMFTSEPIFKKNYNFNVIACGSDNSHICLLSLSNVCCTNLDCGISDL